LKCIINNTMRSTLKIGLTCRATSLLALLGTVGCGESSDSKQASGNDGPVYATMTNVYNDEDRTVYVALTESLDEDIDFDEAYELAGVGNMEAIGGNLLLSSGESPLITKYQVSPPADWQEQGSLSFANFPLEDNANFFYQYLVDEHHMYMPFDGYKRIVWDPTELEILEVKEDSALEPTLDSLTLTAGGNRSGVRYEGAAMQPFFYKDEDWLEFAPSSYIAVYDPDTHEETKVIEAPCPGLAVPSLDEAGNTYFSTWDYSPLKALYGDGPAPCVARITPDHELDEAFTNDFTAWTGGRYSINFRYIRDGWGLADVLYPEELEDVAFSGPFDPTVREQLWETGPWRVWRIDLRNQRAEPFDGIDVAGLGWSNVQVDDRSFLFVPFDEYTRTRVYELDAEGRASTHTDLLGDASWMRVR
jgi:hypothetical protein